MSKLPQPTSVLAHRLRRVAKSIDRQIAKDDDSPAAERLRAQANTCWQAAGRLDDLIVRLSAMCPGVDVDVEFFEKEPAHG